ncbi:MAG TPA: peptidylprolyl isomerase [Pyrinomonadaceae bacterium]|nr:peptidylprolyl isomerase [Pyrinomonadaceae bacterium]
MNLKIVVATILFCSAALAQTTAPSKEPQKANSRPPASTSVETKGEPFDGADAKTMAGQCVRLDTEAGLIEIELYPEQAPESVRNFLNLTATGLFDTTTFSRVVPGFVIQGGNIWSREGGKVSREMGARARRTIPDEPNKILHERGVVSMARPDEPNQAKTDFFILVAAASYLDGKFAAFGRVTTGMEVVDEINKAAVNDEKPEKPVRVKKATTFGCVPSRR